MAASIRTRGTSVRRVPMWNPDPSATAGGPSWVFVPADTTHNITESVGGSDDVTPGQEQNVYLAKGYIPMAMVTDPAALALLPTNWRERAGDVGGAHRIKGDYGVPPGTTYEKARELLRAPAKT
jgi:hypothetical protein